MSDMLAATKICPPSLAEFLENGVFGKFNCLRMGKLPKIRLFRHCGESPSE
jgi:hypothetical protein